MGEGGQLHGTGPSPFPFSTRLKSAGEYRPSLRGHRGIGRAGSRAPGRHPPCPGDGAVAGGGPGPGDSGELPPGTGTPHLVQVGHRALGQVRREARELGPGLPPLAEGQVLPPILPLGRLGPGATGSDPAARHRRLDRVPGSEPHGRSPQPGHPPDRSGGGDRRGSGPGRELGSVLATLAEPVEGPFPPSLKSTAACARTRTRPDYGMAGGSDSRRRADGAARY